MFRRLLLAVLIACACFSEPGVEPPVSGSSTSSDCEPGTTGCACRDDGSCDPSLECIAGSQICAPQGCTPGTLACVCVGGACLGDLACVDGVCDGPSATGSTTAVDPDTSSTAASSSESSGSTDPATTDGSCGPLTCGMCNDCAECLTCAYDGGPCEDERAACTGDCATLLDCVALCPQGPSQCPMTCCCQTTTAWEPFNALMACLWGECMGCAPPLCATDRC